MPRSTRSNEPKRTKRPPATSPEARENQLIALAVDLAEKQLSEGTASSQVMTHYLKLGTTREQLEREKLAHENELLKARKQQIESAAKVEELYMQALQAMRSYSGEEESNDSNQDL